MRETAVKRLTFSLHFSMLYVVYSIIPYLTTKNKIVEVIKHSTPINSHDVNVYGSKYAMRLSIPEGFLMKRLSCTKSIGCPNVTTWLLARVIVKDAMAEIIKLNIINTKRMLFLTASIYAQGP